MAYRGGPSQSGGDETTFIEDFMEGVTSLPNEIKRSFDLMKTLDKQAIDSVNELAEAEKAFLVKAKKKLKAKSSEQGEGGADMSPLRVVQDEAAMADIAEKRLKAQQIVEEKVAIADQVYQGVESHLHRLRTDLQIFEEKLKDAGEFDTVGAKPGEEVAIQTDPSEDLWVLARVLEYDRDIGEYKVMDEDDNSKTYDLPESRVIELERRATKLTKGEEILAVYPDTTSFYRAIVTQMPRRGGAGGSATVGVQFMDDADETGATPTRQVLLRHAAKREDLVT